MTEDRGSDYEELSAALDRVVAVARAHLRAVTDAGEAAPEDPAVARAHEELAVASLEYDELLYDVTGEVTPWEVADEPPAAVSPGEGEDRPEAVLSVRQRRDYAVPSVAVLVSAAELARRKGGHGEPVADVGEAVLELLRSGDGALGSLEVPELEPLRGVVTVSEVIGDAEPLDLGEVGDDAVFALGPGERVLVRVDEEPGEDDDDDEDDEDGNGGGRSR